MALIGLEADRTAIGFGVAGTEGVVVVTAVGWLTKWDDVPEGV